MKKTIPILIVLLAITFLSTGCGKKTVQEKLTEKAIENSLGGNADVNLSDKNVKVETKEGSVEVGENVKLPADFPEDVFVIDGQLIGSYHATEQNSYTVSLQTDKSIADVQKLYEEKLKSFAWKIIDTINLGEAIGLRAEKDTRSLSVMINYDKNTGKTGVILGINNK